MVTIFSAGFLFTSTDQLDVVLHHVGYLTTKAIQTTRNVGFKLTNQKLETVFREIHKFTRFQILLQWIVSILQHQWSIYNVTFQHRLFSRNMIGRFSSNWLGSSVCTIRLWNNNILWCVHYLLFFTLAFNDSY